MSRFDEYIKSNEGPGDLCREIDELKMQIEKMKCCGNCNEPCWDFPIVRKWECLRNNYSLWEILK